MRRRREGTGSPFCCRPPITLPGCLPGSQGGSRVGRYSPSPSLSRVWLLQQTQQSLSIDLTPSRCCLLNSGLSPGIFPELGETPPHTHTPAKIHFNPKKNTRILISFVPSLLTQALDARTEPGATNIKDTLKKLKLINYCQYSLVVMNIVIRAITDCKTVQGPGGFTINS